MIVAMSGMNMVQPAINQIIDMIAVRHRFMATTRPVHMGAGQRGRAAIGIGGGNRDHMLINMIAVDMMEMPIVQIIDMAIMMDGRVAATGAVDMGVIGVDVAAHRADLSVNRRPDRPAAVAPPSCNHLNIGRRGKDAQ